MRLRVFIDTNCFLHLRDLKDLPWREAFPDASAIDLYVAAIVIDELDRLKTEKTRRIRDRCLAALTLIEEASDQPAMRLELRALPAPVALVVAQSPAIVWPDFPRLDCNRPDDELVATALSEPGAVSTVLLSHDTGPVIRARMVGLPAVRAPEEWMLPVQQDVLEKENTKLKRELDAARSTRPTLQARWLDQDETGVIIALVPTLPALSKLQQSRLMERLREDNPRERVSVTDSYPFRLSPGGVDEFQARQYGSDYDNFVERAKDQFSELHTLIGRALQFAGPRLEIVNVSQVTAESLRVAFKASETTALFGGLSDIRDLGGALPNLKAPNVPRDHLMFDHSHLYRLQGDERDRTGFYWLERPNGDATGILTCEEFRPAQSTVQSIYSFTYAEEGELAVEIHASNLSAPITLETQIRRLPAEADWTHPIVLARLPKWIAETLQA